MKTTVPVRIASPLAKFDEWAILGQLRQLGADRIAFTLIDVDDVPFICKELKRLIPFFEKNGIETALWMGGSLMHLDYRNHDFVRRVTVDGETKENCVCSLDGNFLKFYGGLLQTFIDCGVKIIFFDDDFRVNFWTGGRKSMRVGYFS